jgi:hypothetical protein
MAEFMTKTECERLHKDDDEWKKKVSNSLDELNNRLYRDNGHISIQTRLDRGDRILGALCWVTNIAAGAIILGVLGIFWKIFIFVGAQ